MNLSSRKMEEPQVNLTSLIDVVLLLLVFFMVSTSFVKESQISIQLPEADSEPVATTQAERIDIAITAQDVFFVNGRELINARPETLRRAIEAVAGDRSGLPVTISADADARHQSVITAMDIAGQLGFTQVNLATIDRPDD
jgi:biopolymer transport protein ExbD